MRIFKLFDPSFSPKCYYSFIFSLVWISIGLSVFGFVANNYKWIAIYLLSTIRNIQSAIWWAIMKVILIYSPLPTSNTRAESNNFEFDIWFHFFPGLVRSRDGSHLSPNSQPYISLPSPNVQSVNVSSFLFCRFELPQSGKARRQKTESAQTSIKSNELCGKCGLMKYTFSHFLKRTTRSWKTANAFNKLAPFCSKSFSSKWNELA